MPTAPTHAGGRRPLRAAVLAAACLAVGVTAGTAGAAEIFEPADGQVISGVAPEYGPEKVASFAKLTGQPSVAIYARYSDYLEPLGPILKDIARTDAAGLISWRAIASSSSKPGGTMRSIADGAIDRYLVASAAAARSFRRPLFLRPWWEMNGDWFAWSTYTSSGARRSGNSPATFRKAWQRARIIFDGGSRASVNAKLSALGMRGLTVGNARLPATTNVAWVWSVTKGGVKQPRKPHDTLDYYPGDAYTDWVGMTFNQWGSKSLRFYTSETSRAKDPHARIDDLYAELSVRRGKPFMIGEWGVSSKPLGNGDNPAYVADMFAWIRSHPMVKAQVYFNRKPGSVTHRLEDHPRSRAQFRTSVKGVTSISRAARIPR
ncbi:MAG: glycoside hydrolase family 26 protein [Thermoleophilia bacterium]